MRGAMAVTAALLHFFFEKAISVRASVISGVASIALLVGNVSAQTVALTNATVIDGSGASMQRGMTIVIKGSRSETWGRRLRRPRAQP